jgi:hypothetical protein
MARFLAVDFCKSPARFVVWVPLEVSVVVSLQSDRSVLLMWCVDDRGIPDLVVSVGFSVCCCRQLWLFRQVAE